MLGYILINMGAIDFSAWSTVYAAAIIAIVLSFFVNIIIETFLRIQELKNKMGTLSDKDALKSFERLLIGASIALVVLILVILFGFWFTILFNASPAIIGNTTNMCPINDISANWTLAFFTLILVGVTGYYAWETKNIRQEAERMREIANKPIFSFEISDGLCSEKPAVTQSLYLINYGPLARDVHVKTSSQINNGTVKNEKDRYLIAMGTNQKIEILGDYCDIKRNRGKIITNITFSDVNMKLYEDEMPLIIDFNENFDNFLTSPYSIESKDRLAIITALQNLRR